jgi:hypothetical protein
MDRFWARTPLPGVGVARGCGELWPSSLADVMMSVVILGVVWPGSESGSSSSPVLL